jgi:hypothetical protein
MHLCAALPLTPHDSIPCSIFCVSAISHNPSLLYQNIQKILLSTTQKSGDSHCSDTLQESEKLQTDRKNGPGRMRIVPSQPECPLEAAPKTHPDQR